MEYQIIVIPTFARPGVIRYWDNEGIPVDFALWKHKTLTGSIYFSDADEQKFFSIRHAVTCKTNNEHQSTKEG